MTIKLSKRQAGRKLWQAEARRFFPPFLSALCAVIESGEHVELRIQVGRGRIHSSCFPRWQKNKAALMAAGVRVMLELEGGNGVSAVDART